MLAKTGADDYGPGMRFPRALVLVVLTVSLATTTAHAEKSKRTATILAASGTAVASVLVVSSVLVHPQSEEVYKPTLYTGLGLALVTPSLGHFYAGRYLTIGMGIRAAAAVLAGIGFSQKKDAACHDDPRSNCPIVTGGGLVLISLAAIAGIGGIAYDVQDAPDAVESYNRRHAMLTPVANPHGAGLALIGEF